MVGNGRWIGWEGLSEGGFVSGRVWEGFGGDGWLAGKVEDVCEMRKGGRGEGGIFH